MAVLGFESLHGSMKQVQEPPVCKRKFRIHAGTGAFNAGRKETAKGFKSFGDTGIPVKTMTRAGKKYQSPRRDRLAMAEYTPDRDIRPRLKTDGASFLPGEGGGFFRNNIGDVYADTGKRRNN